MESCVKGCRGGLPTHTGPARKGVIHVMWVNTRGPRGHFIYSFFLLDQAHLSLSLKSVCRSHLPLLTRSALNKCALRAVTP